MCDDCDNAGDDALSSHLHPRHVGEIVLLRGPGPASYKDNEKQKQSQSGLPKRRTGGINNVILL